MSAKREILIQPAKRFVADVINNRYMLWCLVVRDIKSRYTGSFIGFFWAVIQPIVTVITYTFVFSYVMKVRLGPAAGSQNFVLWLLCGLSPWLFFSENLIRSIGVLNDNKNLITKSLFPSELLPFSILLSNLVNHLIMGVIVIIAVLIYQKSITMLIFYFPVYLFFLSLASLGISWLISSINVYIRDIGQVITVLINLWFFYTPIVYEPSMAPAKLQFFFKLNPMYYVVDGYRLALLGLDHPQWKGLLVVAVTSVFVTILGALVFKRLKLDFAELL
ncbi:ABC transporter permease [Candidatus Magnetomonas plexicatena]|uniref:ABC transporter permease n=1 Tax=Candidatus Magnetomonas plexicatena TaxID=2552947 RepID=UPI001C773711|nr:ABC transporter permease [Nitrospirales bacterium LBB_01]